MHLKFSDAAVQVPLPHLMVRASDLCLGPGLTPSADTPTGGSPADPQLQMAAPSVRRAGQEAEDGCHPLCNRLTAKGAVQKAGGLALWPSRAQGRSHPFSVFLPAVL